MVKIELTEKEARILIAGIKDILHQNTKEITLHPKLADGLQVLVEKIIDN